MCHYFNCVSVILLNGFLHRCLLSVINAFSLIMVLLSLGFCGLSTATWLRILQTYELQIWTLRMVSFAPAAQLNCYKILQVASFMLLGLGFRSLSPTAKWMDVPIAMLLLTRALHSEPKSLQNRNHPRESGYGKAEWRKQRALSGQW